MTDQRFFFIHIMKTAGGTLRQHIRKNFEQDEVYPVRELDSRPAEVDGVPKRRRELLAANYDLDYLTALPPERRERIRVFSGHFPFVAVELLGMELTTFTILRDPVERTLSHLRALQQGNPAYRGRSLEEIYEDDFAFGSFIANHQAKIFALTVDDDPKSYMDHLTVDEDRLALAKENLESVDVVGMQDDFAEMLAELERRFGWRFGDMTARNVTGGGGEATSFKRRIAEDNRADMEFVDYSRELCERRRTAGAVR
jgi:hypothetical protein